MERSGLRETISTRWKSLLQRSRIAGSVNGKSIIVPRISYLSLLGIDLAASYHYSAATAVATPRGRAPEGTDQRNRNHGGRESAGPRLFPIAKGVNFREDASDR